jgi:hypothetical protein
MDRPENPQSVRHRIEVAGTEDPIPLEARDLEDAEPGLGDPHVDQRLHLEPVTPQHHRRVIAQRRSGIEPDDVEAVPPERVVALAQVGVPGPVEQVDDSVQPVVAGLAHPTDIAAAGTGHEPGALGEVGTVNALYAEVLT